MKIALAGNPNSGKTSIFNHLTGLNQKIGNYPGITVDKVTGVLKGTKHQVLDLPGTYSLYPKTRDEEIVHEILLDQGHPDHPDLIVVTVDASNLDRHLLLFSQIFDLGVPMILALNMTDVATKKGLVINAEKLSEMFYGVPVIPIVARTGWQIDLLVQTIGKGLERLPFKPFIQNEFEGATILSDRQLQKQNAEQRYKKISKILSFVVSQVPVKKQLVERHRKVDQILTHKIWGYLIFLGLLFLIFQAIYAWAEWPMDLIDNVFLGLSQVIKTNFPPGVLTDLIAEGIIPGLGGVLIFIPQITLLFAFIFLMEESGYMTRVVFIMDRLMRPFGLNGRSVVPLISGIACAIPAIMATRTIDNWKERLNTILVTPLMSCSARLPVYTLLIALVIPSQNFGPFNIQGMVLMGLYLIGLLAALLAALVIKFLIKSDQKSFLVMEMPLYKMPRWNNLVYTLTEKIRVFVWDAGRVILAISIILWVLASYGPGTRIQDAVNQIPVPQLESERELYQNKVASVSLSNSYIGIVGKAMEPAIEPLGYNWQIGIALITSFAAREVFVGSMATIYSVGLNFENDVSLIGRMKNEINPSTGKKVYTLASGLSLMIFYAFAMQCMSTLAVTLRETKRWKWPIVQLVYMTAMAYIAAWITFQIMA